MVASGSGGRRQECNRPCPRGAVEHEVLARVRPSPLERRAARRVASYATTVVRRVVTEQGYDDALVTVEGSYAKDTWLSGDLDLDVFVLLPRSECLEVIERGELLDRLRRELSRTFPVEERYAQHPYLRVNVLWVWVEVVLGCRMRPGERPLTAVDRTPLHREYVVSRMAPHQRDEVRLLKAFMKGVGVYGAELAVQGFSGYLVELLVLHYGCFRSVLEAAASWRPPVVVDPAGLLRERPELLERFRGSPMVVPDPVDPARNVAAAVSRRSLATFILASRLYLSRPSARFFEGAEAPPPEEASGALRGRRIVLLRAKPPDPLPPDTLWGIARRAARNAARLLDRLGFVALDHSCFVDEVEGCAYLAVEVLHDPLPELELHRGPPAWIEPHSARFVEKHSGDPAGPWLGEDGALLTLRRRALRSALDALMARASEWVPGSMRGFSLEPLDVKEAHRLPARVWDWLYRFAVKAPPWLRPELYRWREPR